ncbi:glycerophosphodiester phosphodiesterase family protein [Tropicimonas sp. IMCC6043]|uniref:glycerophosphodiester phosphodiesterase family protein n=1 Tax=Tropicimonas sp. IMCC6043 TaxID=2510645 RepID=UPI00101BDBFD|nr:glycerophosphodiester phosphodiesterase family protein [Tropicimonas sp. IMCC6043]RYH10829.1 phosphodiesterase [Tropicimonas sp. IMCC6043]
MALHPGFLTRPLAHRGFHDRAAGRPENSRAAIRAAIARGYGIEIDLQLSADGQAVVFHDDTLDRLTDEVGPVRERPFAELSRMVLKGSTETIPSFSDVLDIVAGQVPLLVEIKDQDGALGPDVGALEKAAAAAARDYSGPLAFMSFNPHSMIALKRIAPKCVRGMTSDAFLEEDWPDVPAPVRQRLSGIPDLEAVGAAFVSHDAQALRMPRIAEIKAAGLPVLCWTIRTPEAEAEARRIADNVTFEGYEAA